MSPGDVRERRPSRPVEPRIHEPVRVPSCGHARPRGGRISRVVDVGHVVRCPDKGVPVVGARRKSASCPQISLRGDNGILALSRQGHLGLGNLELGSSSGHGGGAERGGGASGVEGAVAVGGALIGRARVARERLVSIDVRLCGLRERQGKGDGGGVVGLLGGWVISHLVEVERVGDARVGVRGSLVHCLEGSVVLVGHPVDRVRLIDTLSRELRLLVLKTRLERGGIDGPIAGDDLGDGHLGVGGGGVRVGQCLLRGRDA